MLLHLIKKDILIAKTQMLVILLVIILMPLFCAWAAPEIPSFIPFLYMVIISEIVILQSISQLEAKNSKAVTLLCTTPYVRNTLVKAKYAFFILLFAYCYIAYTVLTLVLNPDKTLDLTAILVILLLSVIIFGVYMPIEFKYGVVKAKSIFITTILTLSLGPMIFSELFADVSFDFSSLAEIPIIARCIALALASIAIFGVSLMLSIRIFLKKEL